MHVTTISSSKVNISVTFCTFMLLCIHRQLYFQRSFWQLCGKGWCGRERAGEETRLKADAEGMMVSRVVAERMADRSMGRLLIIYLCIYYLLYPHLRTCLLILERGERRERNIDVRGKH